jgi:ubiquinone/menaquinone biosynthesis C-methylase UbiE
VTKISSTDRERLIKEKAFHDRRFGGDDSERAAADKYYTIMEKAISEYSSRAISKGRDGTMLEYGCATGLESKLWLDVCKKLVGIDISSEAIDKATQNLEEMGYSDKATYVEMNAEQLEFEDSMFDAIVGNGIIHHLELNACYKELARVLSPSGSAVFIEPTGHNPVINAYRALTPSMRTEDEHPVLMKDIELAKLYFDNVQVVHYNLFTILATPFRNAGFFQPLLSLLHAVDRGIFKIPGMKKYGWTVVMELSQPKK